jgi:hypothetical protein
MKRGHLIDDYYDDMNSDDYLNYYDSYAEGEEQYNENGGENYIGFFEIMENHSIYAEATEDDMIVMRDKERQMLDGCWRYIKNEWNKANPESVAKSSKKHYENNKEEINARRRSLYVENIVKNREAVKERVRKHRQKLKEKGETK